MWKIACFVYKLNWPRILLTAFIGEIRGPITYAGVSSIADNGNINVSIDKHSCMLC